MKKTFDSITSWQFGVMLISVIVDASLMHIPRGIAIIAGSDVWLSMALAGAVGLVSVWMTTTLSERYPEENMFGYGPRLLTRPVFTVIAVFFLVTWLVAVSHMLRVFVDLTKLFFLHRTPIEAVNFAILIFVAYIARTGLEGIARFLELIFPILGIVMAGYALLPIGLIDFGYVLPILSEGIAPVIAGGFYALHGFHGSTLALLIYPFIQNRKYAKRNALIGMGLLGLLYTYFGLATVGFFGPEELKKTVHPFLVGSKTVEIPGGFLERLDIISFALFSFAVFTTLLVITYLCSLILAGLFKVSEPELFVFPLIPVLYILTLLPGNASEVFRMIPVLNITAAFTLIIIPGLMLLLSTIKDGCRRTRR